MGRIDNKDKLIGIIGTKEEVLKTLRKLVEKNGNITLKEYIGNKKAILINCKEVNNV